MNWPDLNWPDPRTVDAGLMDAAAANPTLPIAGWTLREMLTHNLAAALDVWDTESAALARQQATNPAMAEHLARAADLADAARALLEDIAARDRNLGA